MTFTKFLKSIIFDKVVFIRPLWYLNYDKKNARDWLTENTGWQYYGGHHLENRASAFVHTVYHPQKFNIDMRYLVLSAHVRFGKLTQAEALEKYNEPIVPDPELIEFVKKRMAISDQEYDEIMNSKQNNSWKQFKTYKKRFELWRPFFKIMAKANRVPMSFYLKYCFPQKEK